MILGVAGGLLGLGIAALGRAQLQELIPSVLGEEVSVLGPPVLAFTLALGVLAGLLAGVIPLCVRDGWHRPTRSEAAGALAASGHRTESNRAWS